ncbi:hypothetical protein SASPL_157886 [Salvia splendens]|uniref:Myb/SANT-like domain-containing protein n=1 Tax=Salvia splendens TaxID=180675 RepID=A0A8X8VU74_SALSN|nr:hypothetical protein SASPL_157886 [Salvia splendens]
MHAPFSRMMVLNVPLQSHFLYNGKWSSKVDAKLIDTIVNLRLETGWKDEEIPTFFHMAVAREIHNTRGKVFNVPELVTCVRLLAMCYQTFKEVINSKGTYWDRAEHFVHAANTVWVDIIEDAMYTSEDTDYIDVDKEEEEVNSPAIFPKLIVRRKLFDEDDPPTDM